MQRIFSHIERLLLTNDCVIIPEFGGFVIHPYPAVYKSEEHKFCPPGKDIVFNPTLNHYDRLLPESYIQVYGMTFEEAQRSLKKDIEELYLLIEKDGAVYFDKTGVLRKGGDGKLFFEPERNSSFAGLKPYGLYSFHLPPLVRIKQKEQTETGRIIQLQPKPRQVDSLPVHRGWIRVIGVSVAAVGLFLIISTPVKNVYHPSYSASMISPEMILHSGSTPNLDIEEDTTQILDLEIETPPQPTVSEEITQPVVAPPQPEAKADAATQKTYYAIIASFASEKHAYQFMQEINMPELTNMGIVTNEGRVRVYADKFNTKDEAQSYIQRLKENKKLVNTWLYLQ